MMELGQGARRALGLPPPSTAPLNPRMDGGSSRRRRWRDGGRAEGGDARGVVDGGDGGGDGCALMAQLPAGRWRRRW